MALLNVKPVLGSADALKTALGHLLLTKYVGMYPHKLEAKSDSKTFTIRLGLNQLDHTGHMFTDDILGDDGTDLLPGVEGSLDYVMLLVTALGGQFFVHPSPMGADVNVIFPYGEVVTKRHNRATPVKSTRQRA